MKITNNSNSNNINSQYNPSLLKTNLFNQTNTKPAIANQTISNNLSPIASAAPAALLDGDLSIVATASPSPAIVGEILTYTLVVSVDGLLPVAPVLVSFMPTGVVMLEYSLDGGLTWLPWTGSVILPTVIPLVPITILVRGTVSVNCTGSITNTASVISLNPLIPDPNPANNSSTVTTPAISNGCSASWCNNNCNCSCNNTNCNNGCSQTTSCSSNCPL